MMKREKERAFLLKQYNNRELNKHLTNEMQFIELRFEKKKINNFQQTNRSIKNRF